MKKPFQIFRDIRKELSSKGIEVISVKATLNGKKCYKLSGFGFNSSALWTIADIRCAYDRGVFI